MSKHYYDYLQSETGFDVITSHQSDIGNESPQVDSTNSVPEYEPIPSNERINWRIRGNGKPIRISS